MNCALPMLFESNRLYKTIGYHFHCENILNPDNPVLNCLPDEVEVKINMFYIRARYRNYCKCNCILIIR